MNAISMLIQQHRQMEEMFEAALKAEGKERAKLFAVVADALMSHVSIEEEHFYPVVRAKRTEDVLLESLEEHLSLKRVVADLLDLDVADPRYESKLHVLKEQAEHHHEEEEEKLFPRSKKLLADDELDELGDVMEEAQTKLLAAQPRELARAQTAAAAELK
ncbi:MAG: hemerythrin [Myxococcaceae bacterium]|nr:hemerythrin [Myxococcaceae bacterium]